MALYMYVFNITYLEKNEGIIAIVRIKGIYEIVLETIDDACHGIS